MPLDVPVPIQNICATTMDRSGNIEDTSPYRPVIWGDVEVIITIGRRITHDNEMRRVSDCPRASHYACRKVRSVEVVISRTAYTPSHYSPRPVESSRTASVGSVAEPRRTLPPSCPD